MACQSMHDSVTAWLVEGADVERELDDIGNPAVDHWGDILAPNKIHYLRGLVRINQPGISRVYDVYESLIIPQGLT